MPIEPIEPIELEGVVPFPDTGEARSIVFLVVGSVSGGSGFNDCRDDCTRFHKGIDLVAQRLQPIVSPVDGVTARVIQGHPAAGFGVVVRDQAGYEYLFVHLNNDAPAPITAGTDRVDVWSRHRRRAAVVAGQLIGFVGDSGVAEVGVPHVHLEIRRPDGVLLNPAWSLQSARHDGLVCAGPRAVTEEWLTVGGIRVSTNGFRPVDDASCRADTITATLSTRTTTTTVQASAPAVPIVVPPRPAPVPVGRAVSASGRGCRSGSRRPAAHGPPITLEQGSF